MGFDFPAVALRGRCLKVVDGDTVDLELDLGFHLRFYGRFRLLGIDTPELNSKDPVERAAALQAKDQVVQWLNPLPATTEWPLLVTTAKDPDSFGRWLATVATNVDGKYVPDIGRTLIEMGLAVEYKR
jgi:micrococcal nuclease